VALKRGFKALVNAADLSLEYQLGGIIARQAFIDANPELTQRFARAGSRRVTIHSSPGGLGGGNAPFWAAVRWGLFERYGVEVVPTPVKGGMAAIARALSSGDLQIATVAAASLIDACLGGAELVAIMGLMNKLGFQIMSQPEIRAPADLRGRRLASSRGGTDAVIWRWFLPQHGLAPGKDAALVEVPDNEVQMDLLRRREIDAMTLSPAGSTHLKLEGFHELVDFSQQDIDFQLGTVVTTRAFLASHRDEVLAYLHGHVAAPRRYKRQPEAGMQVLRSYTGIGHPEVPGHLRHLQPQVPGLALSQRERVSIGARHAGRGGPARPRTFARGVHRSRPDAPAPERGVRGRAGLMYTGVSWQTSGALARLLPTPRTTR
jgi:ABC-type nitrate/sulfonate/bicarbonate transport system substrate-binding protein